MKKCLIVLCAVLVGGCDVLWPELGAAPTPSATPVVPAGKPPVPAARPAPQLPPLPSGSVAQPPPAPPSAKSPVNAAPADKDDDSQDWSPVNFEM